MGMGAVTAELFAARGAKIVVADVNEDLGTRQARKIVEDGGGSIINISSTSGMRPTLRARPILQRSTASSG